MTAVVQVGLPSDRAQYVHRLGRTARAGTAGGGHLLLADFETFFLSSLRDLPLQTRPPLAAAEVAALQPVLRQGFGALGTVTLGTSYQAPGSLRLAPASHPPQRPRSTRFRVAPPLSLDSRLPLDRAHLR